MSMWRYVAPGKILICGEYAVAFPGGEGIVSAVNAGVSAQLTLDEELGLLVPGLADRVLHPTWDGQKLSFREDLSPEEQQRVRFVQSALELTFAQLARRDVRVQPFLLSLTPVGDPIGPTASPTPKLGLGSSAAATVAAIACVLAAHGQDPETERGRKLLFQFALAAHRAAQGGHGSGIDVAASVYGGTLWFRGGDPEPTVMPLEWPEALRVLVAWTGAPEATGPRVAAVTEFRAAHRRWFEQWMSRSGGWTRYIIEALRHEAHGEVLRGLAMHRQLLLELGQRVGLQMENPALVALGHLGGQLGVAKQSGAGGGDCGILVLRDQNQRYEAEQAIRRLGILPLNLKLPAPGLHAQARASSAYAQVL